MELELAAEMEKNSKLKQELMTLKLAAEVELPKAAQFVFPSELMKQETEIGLSLIHI